jgi:cell division septal protein FtsQ
VAELRRASARSRAAVVAFPRAGTLGLGRVFPSRRALAAGFVLLGLAGAAYGIARHTSTFAVRTIVVRGAPPTLAADVREALAPALGKSLLAVDLPELERRATELPDVAAVRWDRAFPHDLVATVTPERPAAVLRQGSEAWLLSERARVLRALPRTGRPPLPRIWVPRSVEVEIGARLVDAPVTRSLAALLPLPADFPTRVRSATAHRGLVLDLATGLELRLGDDRDIPLKLAVASRILSDLPPPVEGGPTYLDVSVPERPVAGVQSEVEAAEAANTATAETTETTETTASGEAVAPVEEAVPTEVVESQVEG